MVVRCCLALQLSSIGIPLKVNLGLEHKKINKGGSPGLVVMGGDSRARGRGFESKYRILDGLFSHIVKIVLFI